MPHILFLMSDTGGGHRAASRAIDAALQERYPGQFSAELLDVWKDYYPFPFNTLPRNYSRWVNTSPGTYSAQFWFNDHVFRNEAISQAMCVAEMPRMKRLFAQHPADLVVCVHSAFVRPAAFAHRRMPLRSPFVTVITDYALPIVVWYSQDADLTLAPTQPAFERGLALGLAPDQIVLTGAPVHPKFTRVTITKAAARASLGWDENLPAVLVIGGGDGMGPLVATAKAIDASPVKCQIAIVAGRNEELKAALDALPWNHRTHVYGFVNNIEVLMRAADLMVSKAGPATITEAALIGLPLVLSGAIPFQESPNTDYVVQNGAGVSAPGPERVAGSVTAILSGNGPTLQQLTNGIRKLAEPDAIWKIADEIAAVAQRGRRKRAPRDLALTLPPPVKDALLRVRGKSD